MNFPWEFLACLIWTSLESYICNINSDYFGVIEIQDEACYGGNLCEKWVQIWRRILMETVKDEPVLHVTDNMAKVSRPLWLLLIIFSFSTTRITQHLYECFLGLWCIHVFFSVATKCCSTVCFWTAVLHMTRSLYQERILCLCGLHLRWMGPVILSKHLSSEADVRPTEITAGI